jgi:hypothetical protein
MAVQGFRHTRQWSIHGETNGEAMVSGSTDRLGSTLAVTRGWVEGAGLEEIERAAGFVGPSARRPLPRTAAGLRHPRTAPSRAARRARISESGGKDLMRGHTDRYASCPCILR